MSDDRRRLVATYRMPERATSAERVASMDADVREAAASLKRTLTDKATTLSIRGYTLDDDSWEFIANGRVIVGTVQVNRAAQ